MFNMQGKTGFPVAEDHSRTILRHLILLCTFLGPGWLCSPQQLSAGTSTDHGDRPSITVSRSFLNDDTTRLTLDQVISPELAGRFSESSATIPSFGFTPSVIWARFLLESDAECTAIVELSSTRIDHVCFFELRGARISQTRNINFVDSQSYAPAEYPSLKIRLSPGQPVTVLCRLQSEGSLTLPWLICLENDFRALDLKRRFVSHAQIGSSVAVILIAFLLALLFKDWSFGTLGLASLAGLGYGVCFDHVMSIPSESVPSALTRQGSACCALISATFMLGFAGAYAGFSNLSKRDRLILVSAALFSVTSLAAQFFLPHVIIRRWMGALIVVFVLVELWIASNSWRQTRRRDELAAMLLLALCHTPPFVKTLQLSNAVPSYLTASSLRFAALPVIVSSMCAVLLRRRQVIEQFRLKSAMAQAGETQAKLLALRYQLNPHMLFNCLTTVSWLSDESPEKIPPFIDNLATILQSQLRPSSQQLSTVADELRLARCLLELASMRFAEQLRFSIESSEEANAWRLPELILQPLIENAIKYSPTGIGEICVTAVVRHGRLLLTVANPVPQPSAGKIPESLKIGHANIRQRLDLFYGNDAEFHFTTSNSTVTAQVELASVPAANGTSHDSRVV